MNDPTLTIFDQLAETEKRALTDSFGKRDKTIAACGDSMKLTITTLRDRGWDTHEAIWNPALFLNTVAYDLSIGIFDLAYERDSWKRRLVGRSVALLLFEIGEDIPAVFGKNFREAANSLGVPRALLDTLGVETKNVSAFWNQNRILLKDIRTIAGAHRDHDAIALHQAIDGIDLFALLGLGTKLGSTINDLGSATQSIINFTANIKPPELTQKA